MCLLILILKKLITKYIYLNKYIFIIRFIRCYKTFGYANSTCPQPNKIQAFPILPINALNKFFNPNSSFEINPKKKKNQAYISF